MYAECAVGRVGYIYPSTCNESGAFFERYDESYQDYGTDIRVSSDIETQTGDNWKKLLGHISFLGMSDEKAIRARLSNKLAMKWTDHEDIIN